MTTKRAALRLPARAAPCALAGAILIAGCGGGSSSGSRPPAPARPATPAQPAAPAVEPLPTPAAPPPTPTTVTGSGIRSFATISTCLRTHDVPTSAPQAPAGVAPRPSTPKILLVMPWDAVQITVYDAPHAATSSVTLADGGAVMSRGNVSLALDLIPEPPAAAMRTIEACALG